MKPDENMSQGNENPGNQSPNRNTGDRTSVTICNGTTSESQNIELSFENFELEFKKIDGAWRISLRQIAEYYEVPFKQAERKISQNRELYRDMVTGAVQYNLNGSVIDRFLTTRDTLQFLSTVSYKRYSDERKKNLIKLKNWMADTAEKVLAGEVVHKNEYLNADRLSDNRFEVAHDAGLRKAIFHKVCRQQHPTSPNSVRKYHEVCRNDQKVILGFEKEWIPRYTKTLTKEQTIKDHAQKLISTCAILCGHTSPDRINSFVCDALKGLPERYVPDYLPMQIETTKQMNLIEATA
jgi:hypothetical protein